MRRIVVVGGGIAGLATALAIRDRAARSRAGIELTVLEATGRPGGNLRTDRIGGWTVEWGPNGFLDNVPATSRLVERLGIEDRVVRADPAAAIRYLYRDGSLHRVPTGPVAFLRSPLLGLRARLRVLAEPFASPPPPGVDETVHAFAARRIGREAADVLVDAMVSGVFAGDARALSLASTFPKMARMEAEHGSLVRAMLARRRRREGAKDAPGGGPAGPGGTLTSFDEGIETLVEALAAELGPALRTDAPARALRRAEPADRTLDGDRPRWVVEFGDGERLAAHSVVLALSAPAAADLVGHVDRELARLQRRIPHAGLAVVALGFRAADLGGEPRGFGFLVPRGEGLRMLGGLWDSSIFPGRAPEDRVLMRVMVGGAHDPEAVRLPEEKLRELALEELAKAMDVDAEPVLARVYRHPSGIAQYTVGHAARLARIARRLEACPGLHVTGSSYFGISMNLCIERAAVLAERVGAELEKAPLTKAGRT